MVISLATVRASSARSRQYFGSLIGTLAMGLLLEPIMATIALDHGDDRALGGFQLFANRAAGHFDCRHHVAEIMAAADQLRSGSVPNHAGAHEQPHSKSLLGKRSGCRTAARLALLSADTGAIEKSSSAAVHAAVGGASIIR